MSQIKINPRASALLVMDCQGYMVDKLPLEARAKLLDNLSKVIRAARDHAVIVIYVIVQYRSGYPEVPSSSGKFSRQKKDKILQEGNPDAEICSKVHPQPGDIIIVKKRMSAFTGTELDIILRSKNINTLVLSGVSTLGAVESTARNAYDMDYQIFILGDCCADRVSGSHEIALNWMMPRISTVYSSEEFIASIA